MQTFFQGEVQFRRYSDTSAQGQQVVLTLPGRDELEPFIGKEGARFMCVMVEIGPDELPVDPAPLVERAKGGPLAQLAGRWCDDPQFREWLDQFHPRDDDEPHTTDTAASWVRSTCGINSRAELDHNPRARTLFDQHFRIPYNRYLQGE